MALLGATLLAIWLGQLLIFLLFPRSLPALLWYLVNVTEPLTGVRLQWTETLDGDEPEHDLSGSDDSGSHDSAERALLINCEKGRVSSIIVKKCSLSSLWDLLLLWKCEISVQNLHITLRRKKKITGAKKPSFSSAIARKVLQQPWLWRWMLRGVALVAPDTVLDASFISIRDPKAHKKITVDNVTAELIGRSIWSMTAGAVVSGVAVKDTEPAFSQRLVSIDSICMQWVCLIYSALTGNCSAHFNEVEVWVGHMKQETESTLRVVQSCSMVLGKTQICLNAPALLEQLAKKAQGAKKGKSKASAVKKPFDPSAAVSAALAYFPVLPETLSVYCTTIEVSAPLGSLRAVAPGVKITRKRRHSLMHAALSPADGVVGVQEATIPYLTTCMRLLKTREKLSARPAGQSFSTTIDTPTHTTESLFGQRAGLTLNLVAGDAVSGAHVASAVATCVSDAVNAAMQAQGAAQRQSPDAEQPASELLDSTGGRQQPTRLSMQSDIASPHVSAEGHEPGISSSQQLSHHSNALGESGMATGVTDDVSGNVNSSGREYASETADSSAMVSESGRGSAMSTAPSVLDPSAFGNASDGQESVLQGTGSLQAHSVGGESTGQFVDAAQSGVKVEEEKAGTPKTQAGGSPRGKRGAKSIKPDRRTVSVVVSTGALAVSALGGSLSLYNGASKSSVLLDGPAGGRSGELQALSVALGVKDMHGACLCASLWSFEEGHRVLQTLSSPTVSQIGVSLSPLAESDAATVDNGLEDGGHVVGGPTAVFAEAPSPEPSLTTSDQSRASASHESSPSVSRPSSKPGAVPDVSSSGVGASTLKKGANGVEKAQQMVAAALKSTSWQLNLQLDDEASLLVVDGGSRDAEKMFGKPGGPKCKTLILQCGRSVAAVGAAPEGCMLPIEISGEDKVSISSLASPFVVAKLPANASRYQAPGSTPTTHRELLFNRQIEAAASPEVQESSGGGQLAVVLTCQDVCTAFTTSFANEKLGLAAAHKPLWKEALQTVRAADRWDFEHLAEGPQEGLSGAGLLHLLQQDNVLQHAASWSHVSVEIYCSSTENEFAGPYNVSTATALTGFYADVSPHQLMTAMDAAASLKQIVKTFSPKSDSPSVSRGAGEKPPMPEIASFSLQTQLTDCQITWSQLVAQQALGTTLPTSTATGAQSTSNGSQISASTSALSSSNKSFLSLPASTARSVSPGASGVHFLFLHDCWTLTSLKLDGSYSNRVAEGSASVEGASWGCQWQELRSGYGQSLLNVYSVSSPRFLPHVTGMDPAELYRLLSPDVDVDPVRFDLTDSDLMPCSFVTRRKQAVFVDDRFQDAPSVTHVPALRLHQALVHSDARRVCGMRSMLAQAVSLNLEEPWFPDSQPSPSLRVGNEGLTVDIEDCTAELDIDIGLIHIAAAQHATVLAQWLPKLLNKKKSPASVPNEFEAASKLSSSKLQPHPGNNMASLLGSGAMSTQSSTISAMYDVQNTAPNVEQLSSMTSMHTAASLTPAPSGPGKPPKRAIDRILKQSKVSLKSVSASCAIGGRDTLNLQFDGCLADAGESCKFQNLSVFMNGCSVVEALDLGARIKVSREDVTGVDDLKAEVEQVSLHVSGRMLLLCVPHSQDPGRLYAFSRLWEKPLLQVVRAHMQDLKESISRAKALLKPQELPEAASNSSLGATASPSASEGGENQANVATPAEEIIKKPSAQLSIKLSCEISELAVRIENHSLERKLCLLYPVHKRTAALQTALSAAMGAYGTMQETSLARASAKRSEKSDKSVVQEPELPADVEDRLSQNIVAHDMCQCMDTLAVAHTSQVDQPGHLFNIACSNVCGSIVVDGRDAVSFAAADLDRATQGLTISDAQRIQVDMRTDALVLRFGTMQNPMLEATSMAVSGPVVMARLASLPPQTDKITVHVGSWHSIPVPVARSGCRPPPKAYTDLAATLGGVNFQITAGLEPAFAAMAQCTKRIIPPSRVLGDATLPPPDPNESPVAWWDRMRYMWRGRMRCTMSDACFTISTALTPDADATTQRMDFRAKVFDLSSDPDAQLSLGLEGTTATLLTPHHEGRSRPDAPLLRVPLFSLSNATITNNLTIELPNGRALSAHHIFPAISLGQRVHAEGVQGPVDVSSVLAAQNIAANINISIRSLALPGMVDNQTIPLAQAGVVYYSEEMMAFIRDLQKAFGSPPRYLRQAFKRSEDFWHKRTHKSAGGPKMSLGELFSYMNMNIHGVDCAMQHHVVASGDPGEVHARPEDVNVECRWTFTSSNPHKQEETVGSADIDFVLNSAHSLRVPSVFTYSRGASVKSTMSSLSVSATNVRLLRLEMTPHSAARGASMDDGRDIGTFHQVHAHADEHDGSVSGTSDGASQCKAYGWEDMGSIRSLSVFQAPAPPSTTDEKRPIIVVSESAHLIISETSRQALGSIILHCKAPFGPKSDPSSTPADAAGDDDRASLQDASSDLTGRLQELHDPRSAGSFQRGQLDLQDLVLNAGQVVEVPASDYVSTTSGGDQAKSSQIKGSSVVLDKTPPDFESYALTWKVQVSDLQVAFLSTRWLGTAQFVADDCNISHSIKNATEYTDALASNAALYIMSHDVDMQNPVCWLEKGVSGYSLPDMEQQVNPIRLCVQPCQLQFRSQAAHAKSELDTNTKNNPVQYLHMKVDMKSAHIQTSSYEYDVLTDVISHLIISPVPQVPTMARHRRRTPVDSDAMLCTLRAAMSPKLRAMWGQQRLLAAMNTCTPALGYLPRDPGLLHSKPSPPPVPDLSFDFHYPSGGGPSSPASETGVHPSHRLRSSSHSLASSRVPFKGFLSRNSMHLNHGVARLSPVCGDSQLNASGLHPSTQLLSAHSQPSTVAESAFCPLRTSVETMAATQLQPQRASHSSQALFTSPSTFVGTRVAGSGAQLDSMANPSPSATPPVATGTTPHAWGGSRSTAPSPEHRPPLAAGTYHRKSSSMGGRGAAAALLPTDMQQPGQLSRHSNGPIGAGSNSLSPVRGAESLAVAVDSSPMLLEPSGRDRGPKSRPPSPLKAGMRPREGSDAGLYTSAPPNLLTTNPRLSLPLAGDRAGEQGQLAGSEDAELNSKQRQNQLQLQLNQIKDYLNKGDAEVFSKCIVPFLKADSYLQSGEISEDTFTVMLHTCLINWLDNDTTTQEKVVVSLEDTMDKERLVLEEALIRRRRAEDLSHSVQLHLFIQQLSWTLHKPDGKPLVSVEGSDISFSRTHHRDRTGYCKAQIRDLNVKDLTASLAISKQLPKGMMLSKLKDAAWRKEGFLLVNVIRGRPTPDEVVYNHIDIKLHPLLVQLDGTMISALTSFFKVQKTGADVEEKRLDKVMGLAVIARAEKLRSKLHLKQDSIDEGSQVAQFVSSMNLQGVGSVQMGSMLSLRPTLSMMSSASVPDGDSFFQSYIPSRQRADTRSSLPVVPVSRAASTMSSLPSMDLQTVHAQSLLESSPVRQHRGSTEAPVRVSVEPRVHRYQNVTFSPTIVSISLKVDNMKFARCEDKVIRVPDQRYENMQNARPATLMSRYGWDLACSFLRGMLTIGGSSKSSFGQSVSTDSIKQDMMTGEEKMTLPSTKPKSKLLSGKSVWNKMKKMGSAGSSNDKS